MADLNTGIDPTQFDIPHLMRRSQWVQDFNSYIMGWEFQILKDQPVSGPDAMPYLLVATRKRSVHQPELALSVTQVLRWLDSKGIGLVINPMGTVPDYVLPYGMIWHFCEHGLLARVQGHEMSADPQVTTNAVYTEADRSILGPPSAEYLPTRVRTWLRRFLNEQGVLAPMICVAGSDYTHVDLCFSLTSLGNPPPHEHAGILKTLSWFLPPHYNLALVATSTWPFAPL